MASRQANSNSSGIIAPVIHGMIDANAYHSSRVTWLLELSYVQGNGESKSLKEIVEKKFHGTNQGKTTIEMGNILVNINTEMYNKDNGEVSFRDGEMVNEWDKKDIPSLIIATTMDMEFAHLRGYKGETIQRDKNRPFHGWEIQIKDTETVAALNPLRLFPLFCYDPRRYRYAENTPRDTMIEGCGTWKDPFKRIVGYGDSADGIKKIWLGFCMNPILGFRPFDELCEHLQEFYKECETNEIPILAHCAPSGIIAHRIMAYNIFDAVKEGERREKSKIHNDQSVLCSEWCCGTESVVDDTDLNQFYMNYGHPRNWIPVLEYCPDIHLCLTGFGGNREWQQADWTNKDAPRPTREWIRCIIKLTAKYKNVYADISGLNIYDKKIRSGLLEMLKLIQNGHGDFEHLKRKLIFGSDWYLTHLIGMSNSTETLSRSYGDYCREIKIFFDGIDPSGEFWECVSLINPWDFYGLDSNKIQKMHDELAKNTHGIVNCDMLAKMIHVFNNSEEG